MDDLQDIAVDSGIVLPRERSAAGKTKQCPRCGKRIAEAATKCSYCQSAIAPIDAPQSRMSNSDTQGLILPGSSPNPFLSAALSLCCISGLGQIMNGQIKKGVACVLGTIVLALITFGFSIFVTFPLLAVDAYMVAKKLKSGKPVAEWENFPSS